MLIFTTTTCEKRDHGPERPDRLDGDCAFKRTSSPILQQDKKWNSLCKRLGRQSGQPSKEKKLKDAKPRVDHQPSPLSFLKVFVLWHSFFPFTICFNRLWRVIIGFLKAFRFPIDFGTNDSAFYLHTVQRLPTDCQYTDFHCPMSEQMFFVCLRLPIESSLAQFEFSPRCSRLLASLGGSNWWLWLCSPMAFVSLHVMFF